MFKNSATAGTLTNFTSDGGVASGQSGGRVIFQNTATAGSASFTNHGGTANGALGGSTQFFNSATAANGVFINNASAIGGAGEALRSSRILRPPPAGTSPTRARPSRGQRWNGPVDRHRHRGDRNLHEQWRGSDGERHRRLDAVFPSPPRLAPRPSRTMEQRRGRQRGALPNSPTTRLRRARRSITTAPPSRAPKPAVRRSSMILRPPPVPRSTTMAAGSPVRWGGSTWFASTSNAGQRGAHQFRRDPGHRRRRGRPFSRTAATR